LSPAFTHKVGRGTRIGNKMKKGSHQTKEAKLKNSLAHRGKNHPNWGKHLSEETRYRIGIKQKGENNWNWTGEHPKYWAAHKWVTRHYGKPDTCEMCGKSGLKAQKINWASIGHLYLRSRNNWLRLCVKCHRKYDRKYNAKHIRTIQKAH